MTGAAASATGAGVETADFLIVGGGIAGLSAAARLARHGRTIVLEAEDSLGYHSSGRSVAFSHHGIGDATVRGLTAASREFFLSPPAGFSEAPVAHRSTALYIATREMLPELDRLEAAMARFTAALRRTDEAEMRTLFPPLRTGPGGTVEGVLYEEGLRLDSDALNQGYARIVRAAGGAVRTGMRIDAIGGDGGGWRVEAAGSAFRAPVLIDAAGAWADEVAILAGVRPLGLSPLRRTVIVVDPPAGADVRGWPFVKTAVSDFYMLPEGGRLIASPVDEVPSGPCDARPEEMDVALAAWKAEQYTTLKISRIVHEWAGLRTFTPDRAPAAGFAPDAPGFFWLAGQGGFGLQTAPAMAEAVEALIVGAAWPERLTAWGVGKSAIDPARFFSD